MRTRPGFRRAVCRRLVAGEKVRSLSEEWSWGICKSLTNSGEGADSMHRGVGPRTFPHTCRKRRACTDSPRIGAMKPWPCGQTRLATGTAITAIGVLLLAACSQGTGQDAPKSSVQSAKVVVV